ncbi:hypothetical protein HYX12_04210 [Candidatus Woesearchaeota archaeon]|nr:hypothetical protein [Candidatus Woesearchaeota archaeon]
MDKQRILKYSSLEDSLIDISRDAMLRALWQGALISTYSKIAVDALRSGDNWKVLGYSCGALLMVGLYLRDRTCLTRKIRSNLEKYQIS